MKMPRDIGSRCSSTAVRRLIVAILARGGPSTHHSRRASFFPALHSSLNSQSRLRLAMKFLELADVEQLVDMIDVDVGEAGAKGRKYRGALIVVIDRGQPLELGRLDAVVKLGPFLEVLTPAERVSERL